MLTYYETVRQLVRALYSRRSDRLRALSRRALVRNDRSRDFQRRRQASSNVVERALHHLVGLKKQGAFEAADRQYAMRRGPAAIDLIMDAAIDGLTPPPLRRTCSPHFTPPIHSIEFGDWELSDTDGDDNTARPCST
jgi:hypothetical protein